MIVELVLLSNDVAITRRFWAAIFGTAPVALGDGEWRVTHPSGLPAVRIRRALTWHHITTVDLTVVCDAGAADRLREQGFEVSSPGFPLSAVDGNGTDSTVKLVVPHSWDGVSDVDWEEPDDVEKERIERLLATSPVTFTTGAVRRIEADDVTATARFIAAWYGCDVEIGHKGVARIVVGDEMYRIEPVQNPQRRWYMFGARDYAASVERCAAAGFAVIPAAQAPDQVGHIDIGLLNLVVTVDRR